MPKLYTVCAEIDAETEQDAHDAFNEFRERAAEHLAVHGVTLWNMAPGETEFHQAAAAMLPHILCASETFRRSGTMAGSALHQRMCDVLQAIAELGEDVAAYCRRANPAYTPPGIPEIEALAQITGPLLAD